MKDFTSGSLSGHLLKTTSFMVVSMVFQTMYVLVDLYWVGRLGTDAVAAVGLSSNLMFVVLAATQMLGVGTTSLISHAIGRKDQARARLLFNQANVLSLVVGVLFLAMGMALRHTYVTSLSADVETARLAGDYLAWFIPAMALQFGMVTMAAALRGTGNFKPGMVVQTSTVVLNTILAPVLVFGWGTGHALGVAGAAIASLLAIGAGVVWLSTYFFRAGSYLTFHIGEGAPQWTVWKQILKIGLPAGAEFALTAVYLVIVYLISRPFGAAAQAGFGIGLRLMQTFFLPAVALGFSVAPVAGQNFGARNAERVRGTFITATAIVVPIMLALAALQPFIAAPLVGLFTNDPAAIEVGADYLHLIAWNFASSGVIFISSSMFQAMGNSLPSLITSIIRVTLVAVPAVILSTHQGFNLRWIWYLSIASVTLQLVLNLWLLQREYRLRMTAA